MAYNSHINQINSLDRNVALGAGILFALLDSFCFPHITLPEADELGRDDTLKFIENFSKSGLTAKWAKHQGIPTGRLDTPAQQIRFLEQVFQSDVDKTTNSFGGGLFHHFRDLSHHASFAGLFCSLYGQFCGKAFGFDSYGKLRSVPIEGWNKNATTFQKLFSATFIWFGHLASDMAGASSTLARGGQGTGIPGPLVSSISVLSRLPGISSITLQDGSDLTAWSQKMALTAQNYLPDQAFHLDLSTELGLLHGQKNDMRFISPLAVQVTVLVWYAYTRKPVTNPDDPVRHSFFELWNRQEIERLTRFASTSFVLANFGLALGKAYIRNKTTGVSFEACVLEELNAYGGLFMGLTFCPAVYKAVAWLGNTLSQVFVQLPIQDELYSLQMLMKWMMTHNLIGLLMLVLKEVKKSQTELQAARERRIMIEQECDRIQMTLENNRREYEEVFNSWMAQELSAVMPILNAMNHTTNPEELFALNIELQKRYGQAQPYRNMNEFENFMSDTEVFSF